MKFSLLILSLNEIEGIKKLMPQIIKEFKNEIIVVDGNSKDGTIDYLKENKIKYIIQKKRDLVLLTRKV